MAPFHQVVGVAVGFIDFSANCSQSCSEQSCLSSRTQKAFSNMFADCAAAEVADAAGNGCLASLCLQRCCRILVVNTPCYSANPSAPALCEMRLAIDRFLWLYCSNKLFQQKHVKHYDIVFCGGFPPRIHAGNNTQELSARGTEPAWRCRPFADPRLSGQPCRVARKNIYVQRGIAAWRVAHLAMFM